MSWKRFLLYLPYENQRQQVDSFQKDQYCVGSFWTEQAVEQIIEVSVILRTYDTTVMSGNIFLWHSLVHQQ